MIQYSFVGGYQRFKRTYRPHFYLEDGRATFGRVVLKIEVPGQYGMQFRLKEMDTNYDIRPFSLLNDSFTLLNAELNDSSCKEHTSNRMILPPQTKRLETKQIIRTV
jgi:hypothetical protein